MPLRALAFPTAVSFTFISDVGAKCGGRDESDADPERAP